MVNGLNNPLLITTPYTITVDGNGLPIFPPSTTAGRTISVPSVGAVGGITSGFFAGRVYAPSATMSGVKDLNVFFAGYHTPKPKNGLGDYRTIGRISLHSVEPIIDASTNVGAGNDDDDDRR